MKLYNIITFLFFLNFSLCAQVTTVPYFCGFENSTENMEWQYNTGTAGAKSPNKWVISNAEHYMERHSLLISNDLGVSASYDNVSCAMVVYREFILPQGTYDLSFLWKGMGENEKDGLYVCWLPVSTPTNSAMIGIPSFVKGSSISFNSRKMLQGNRQWTEEKAIVSSNGGPMKLVFVWINDAANKTNPSISIDNVQLASTSCSKPIKPDAMSISETDVRVSWGGSALFYELMYNEYRDTVMQTVKGIQGNNYTVKDLKNGVYDFWVRTVCGLDTSSWVAYRDLLVYSAGANCIDFTNFRVPNTYCTTGYYEDPYFKQEIVDFGPESDLSRHTFNINKGETDPRTNNKLKIVPDGELVSVRLGNWMVGAEAESITYTLTLDINSKMILALQYAVVLESPGHGPEYDPRFKLEIMDSKNKLLDARCSAADFVADDNLEGWNLEAGSGVVWKDWTTIGINLSPYAGQTVKIRLTSYDCDATAHFGYAYYTLACSEAEIEGISCGDIRSASISAPDGFVYEWYKNSVPDEIVSTSKELDVEPTDTSIYSCDIIFKEDTACRFTLSASLLPRYPLAQFVPRWEPRECENFMRFENSSGVTTHRGMTSERCEYHHWDFGNGITSTENNPRVEYPKEGGIFIVKLAVGISDGMCVDTMEMQINIPSIEAKLDTVYHSICQGERFMFNGTLYSETGQYEYNGKSVAGCDSNVVLNLTVTSKIEVTVFDTICARDFYDLNGQKFTQSGTYKSSVKSTGGCDSITTLHLVVRDDIIFDLKKEDALSGPNSGFITIIAPDGEFTHIINGKENGALTDLAKGTYIIVLRDKYGCESEELGVEIDAICIEYDIVPSIPSVCADEETFLIPFELLEGNIVGYDLKFNSGAVATGFENVEGEQLTDDGILVKMPEGGVARPNVYTLDIVLNDLTCGEKQESFTFEILYSSSIMVQKWNDVIALHSKKYNGGYEFSRYKWFRNGLPLENETPILYLNGSNFMLNDVYYVELTRVDDNVTMLSCPMTPIDKPEDSTLYPTKTVADISQKIMLYNISGNGTATWHDYLGREHSSYRFSSEDIEILTPSVPGFYLLELNTEEGRTVYKIYVK